MDDTAKLLSEVRDLQRQLLEAQKEASARNAQGLKTLMIFLFPITTVALLSVAIAAIQMVG